MTSNQTIKNYPLTSTQKEILFDQILHPNVPLYNIGGYVRIDGPIDPNLFEKALNQVIEENDALRIIIHDGESRPTQTFAENVHLKLDYHDFSDKENAQKQVIEWMRQEFVKPFPLYDELLCRFALCKVSDNCYYWFKKYHHLSVDGWAISLIVQRVAAAYNALATGQSLGEQKHDSYQNFIQNDKAYLDSDKFTKAKHYWLDKYREVPEALMVRRYTAQFAGQTIPSQRSILHIRRLFYNQLIDFAKENKASTFHVILGALYCYFVRTGAREDLVVGLPTLNRSSAAFKQTVGLFVGVTPAWFRFGLDLSFIDLIQAIRGELQKNYRYQRFPVSEITRSAGLYAQNRQQLFDIELSYEKHDYETYFDGRPAEAVTFTHGFNQNALTVFIREFHDNQDVRVDFDYNVGFFDEDEIERIKTRFEFLLSEILRRPSVPIRELQLMPEAEYQKILVEFNDTKADYPRDKTIVDLFQEQVEKTPVNRAVVFEGQSLTYHELNFKANQLAHYLIEQRVQAETLVGICVERSLEMVIGLLGILKAGGAYVPLDPDYPAPRLQFMLEDSQVPVLLTQTHLIERLPLSTATTVVGLDREWATIAAYSGSNPQHRIRCPENLAYVIYTSGSTGRPKGAMNTHRGICNRLLWMQDAYQLTTADNVLQKTPFSFDVSVWEFFWPLMVGARLVVAKPGGHQEPAYLVKLITSQNLSTLHFVPSMLQAFVEEPELFQCSSLRRVICSGEALPFELMERFFARLPAVQLHNLYGPTEAAVDVTYWSCQPNSPLNQVPIGCPIANTQIYLLDSYNHPVPIGVPGELHIGGTGLARGYLNRPDLTGERFIPNPFSDDPNARLYKTGDLARYLPDGNLEYLGRIDNQVKIRGFRIELGEIEAVLGQHTKVRENAVVLQETSGADKRLVAYIGPHQRQVIENKELRHFLTERLPDYMVPSAFVTLKALPLTPNGKIDRRALSQLSVSHDHSTEQFVAPSTPEQELLAGIWADVLGVPRVGVFDNFFELGGHSLLATQVISRIRDTFSVELPLRVLFESPTVAALAEQLENRRRDEPLPPITPINRSQPLQLSFAQQRLWFLNQLEGPSATYNMPAALRLDGPLHQPALFSSLQTLVQRHDSLRTTFPTVNGTPVVQCSIDSLAFSVLSLQQLPIDKQPLEVQRLVNDEAIRPFNLETGPLFRATLLQLGANSHVLLLNMHHIISDGWSIGILVREWSVLYEAIVQGESSPLPPLPIQYVDFAHWQRQWLTGEVLEEQLAYWKRQLGGNLPMLPLPTDSPRTEVQSYQGARQSKVLSSHLTEALKTLSQQQNVTLFMTLLAAFKIILYRYTGSDDIIVGTPIASRNHVETEKMIGLFLNTLALRTDLSGNPSFRELLQRIREVALGAYAHQQIPFEKLVEELQPERHLNKHPVFDILFNFVNTPTSIALELPGLTLRSIDRHDLDSKFLMTLYVAEQDGVLNLQLVYQRAFFSVPRIRVLLTQFQCLLEQIVEAIDTPINAYSLVTPDSKSLLPDPRVVLSEPQYETVTRLFLSWVERTPTHSAVSQTPRTWSYRELADAAHAIARVLQTNGVEHQQVVAVFGPRCFGLIASMIGVWLSGGVLLTLDENLPTQRQQLMLMEAQAKYLLYLGEQPPEVKKIIPALTLISIAPDTGQPLDSAQGTEPLPVLTPNEAAYIFFTSGTTGIPKGVLGSHKGLSHFLNWQRQTFVVGPSDRCAQLTGLSFDVVLRDIFIPLTSGATLCLPTEGHDLNPTKILPWLELEQISLLHTVPSLAQSWLVNVPEGVSLQSLRWIFFAGEPLTDQLVRQWRKVFPQAGEIVNLYGPTETTLAKCYYPVPNDVLLGVQPLGYPLPESQALVLGKNHQLCGINEPGEIVVRTPFRSLGYLNAPAEKWSIFVKNPFRNDKQDMLYYTGDRGRYRPDGYLEILGRLDNQIKLRGIRIELEEIEMVLAQHPEVREAVVVVSEEREKQLLAYVVPKPEQAPTPNTLRHFMKNRLPDYMVPSAFVTLEALPLTPNGKINRRALSKDSVFRDQLSEEAFVAPRDTLELQLTQIWEDILNVRPIGVHDNFFELGGHSLLAITLLDRVEKNVGKGLSVRALFQAPTIAQLANILREKVKSVWCALEAIQPQGIRPPLFFIGSTNYARALAPVLGTNQPVYGLNIFGLQPADGTPLLDVKDIAKQYLEEIQTVQPKEPYLLCAYCGDARVAFEMAQQLHAEGHNVALLAFIDVIWQQPQPRPGDSIHYFWRSLLEFGPSYLLHRMQRRLKFLRQSLILSLSKLRKKHHQRQKNALPLELQHQLLIKKFFNALANYVPQPYPGQITLFYSHEWSLKHSSATTLGKFAENGVEVYEIPGYHDTLFVEPQVGMLGEQLKRCLDNATNS